MGGTGAGRGWGRPAGRRCPSSLGRGVLMRVLIVGVRGCPVPSCGNVDLRGPSWTRCQNLGVKGSPVQVWQGSIVGRVNVGSRCGRPLWAPPFGGFSRYLPSGPVPRAEPGAVRLDSPLILHFPSEELRDHPSSRGTVDARNDIDGGDRHRSAGVCSSFAENLRGVEQAVSQ